MDNMVIPWENLIKSDIISFTIIERSDIMIEQDTVKLLRECDAGIKMGVYSIEEVLGDVNNGNFKQMLEKAKSDHQQLQDEIQILLDKYHDDGKDPNPMAKGMSWFKTNIKISQGYVFGKQGGIHLHGPGSGSVSCRCLYCI